MIARDLPDVDHFDPVTATKENISYVDLQIVDLATYDNGPEAQRKLAKEIEKAMTTQGFFLLVNHGIDADDITRQVDIGHTIMNRTSPEEKQRLKAPIVEEGSYFGFKPRGHWRTKGDVKDKIENFNVSRDLSVREWPEAMEPFKPEIQRFVDTTHKEILYKICHLFGLALELDDVDYFVKAHDYGKHDESWLRYMEYFDDYTEEERKVTGGQWLEGHRDLTALSFVFSQPMASLQVRDVDDNAEWKYIRHIPGAIIVNAGEIMQWWTGDYFKAAIHRVHEPPKDQRGHNRSSVFYFAVPNDDIVINTLLDQSPVLRKAGVAMAHKPEDAPTSKQWCNGRIKITRRGNVWDKAKDGASVVEEKVGSVTTKWFR